MLLCDCLDVTVVVKMLLLWLLSLVEVLLLWFRCGCLVVIMVVKMLQLWLFRCCYVTV